MINNEHIQQNEAILQQQHQDKQVKFQNKSSRRLAARVDEMRLTILSCLFEKI